MASGSTQLRLEVVSDALRGAELPGDLAAAAELEDSELGEAEAPEQPGLPADPEPSPSPSPSHRLGFP